MEEMLVIAGALRRLRAEMPRFQESLEQGNPVEQVEAARVLATLVLERSSAGGGDALVKASQAPHTHRAGLVGVGRMVLMEDVARGSALKALALSADNPEPEVRLATVELLGDLLNAREVLTSKPRHEGVRRALHAFAENDLAEVRAAAQKALDDLGEL